MGMRPAMICVLQSAILATGLFGPLAAATWGAGVPRTSVEADWQSSAYGWGGWRVDGEALLFANLRLPASLISAEPVCEKRGGITFRFRQVFGPGARFELRFRAAGDERDYAALVVGPDAGQLSFVRLANGQPVAALGAAVAVGPLGDTPHRLEYRIDGRRVTAVLDAKDVLRAADAAPSAPGRIGLAAAWAEVEVRDLAVDVAPLAADDSFETLAGWTTLYGPESAWHAARGPEAAGSEHVAVFSAAADGAIVSPQEWTHSAVEVRGRFLEAGNTWACFGLRPKLAADGSSHYVIEVRGRQNVLTLYKVAAGQRDPAVARDVSLPPVQTGRWYVLHCEFVGDRITVDFDGKRYLEVVDPNPLEKGRTAISASYATVHLDDFRQQELASDYVFAHTEPPAKPYDAGSALPAAAASGDQDENYWYLDGKDLRAAIHKPTGCLGGLLRRSDGQRLAERVVQLYKVETRSTAVTADAAGDVVQAVRRRQPGSVVLQCANAGLADVRIEKGYAFAAAGDRLIETVRFVNETERPDVFVTLAERMVLEPAFRRDAIYTGGSYFGPLVPASSIRERVLTDPFKLPWVTGITNGRPSWVLALNHSLGTHLATYRYRVNGQYVLPWNSVWTEELHNLCHTPVGWEMGVATLHLLPQQEASAEVQYRLFTGSRLDFYNAYMDLPEVTAMYRRVGPRPAWLRDLKMPVESTSDYALGLTEDGVLLKLDSPFAVWGDLPVTGTVRTGAGTGRWPVERLRDGVRRDQVRSPRLKVGFYTWAWSANHKSAVVGEHPDWFIATDKAGQTRNAYPLALSYLRCLSAPGCLDYTTRLYRDLVEFYGEDFQYLDNDGTGAQIIDWQNLRLDQDYDWQRLHEAILAAARRHPLLALSRRPGGTDAAATFFNNRVLPQGDISFAEFMEPEIQNPDWRRPANEMVPLKILQKRDPDRLIPLLYWRAPNQPSYANYCVGLGLLPWGDRLSQIPFINAAFETRRLEIVDAGLKPDWQRDLSTSVEAYSLRLGRAAVVSFIGHGEAPGGTEMAFDTAPFGLQPGRPFSAWLFELADERDHAGRLTEREQRQAYREAHWADETVVAAQFVEAGDHLPPRYAERYFAARPQRLRMLMLTQSPALTWSVNGQRCNFWLPGNRYLDLDGTWDPAAGTAEVVCRNEADSAEIVLPVLEDWRVLEVTLDGKPVTWDLEAAGRVSLVRLALPHGRHRVHLRTAVREGWPMCRVMAAEAPARVRAGGSLPVHVRFEPQRWAPADGAVLSVLHDGVLVASAKPTRLEAGEAEFAVPVPASARPGVYQLRLSHPDPLSMGGVAGFTVEAGDWKPSAPPGGEVGQPTVKVWDVGRTVRDLRVLRAGTDTFDHRGGTQLAELDVDRLTAHCGLLDEAASPWGYGFCGLEVRGVRSLTVGLQSTFAEAVQDGLELGDRYLDSFAGFIIDYHTPAGYTKRVALSLGVYCPTRPVPAPNWGKAARPDACLAWSRTLLEKPSDTVTVDLSQYAPPDWDGQAWFSVGVDTVCRGLRLEATITKAAAR
jgi:hypothetical protein